MSNMQNKRTIEIDVSDAPMLVHAMQIAANTAMMCGHPEARKRFQQYRDVFKAFAPAESDYFDEEAWGEIGMALAQAKTFRVFLDEDHWDKRARAEGRGRWSISYHLFVQIGEQVWHAKHLRRGMAPHETIKAGDPRVKAVFDVLASLAPIDCEGVMDDQSIPETEGVPA